MADLKPLVFNVFDEACVGLRPHGLWAHPDNTRLQIGSLDYWLPLARLCDEALFHSLFLADVLGVYDIYGDSPDAAIEGAVEFPVYDPAVLIAAMTPATRQLGFILTSSTSYEPPFSLARRLSTLDAISAGRIAWNVVTSYLPNAARNYGLPDQMEHSTRYAIAEEYLQVCYQLWEGSWDDGAVVADRSTAYYADPAKVRRINYSGQHFQVQGPHLVPPTLQRTPVIAQAGSSARGIDFAAANGEVIFLHAAEPPQIAGYTEQLYTRAAQYGRPASDLFPVVGLTVVTGKTRTAAQERYDEFSRWQNLRAHEVHFGGATGFDLSGMRDGDRITDTTSNYGKGAASQYTGRGQLTIGEIRRRFNTLGNGTVNLVGTPDEIADELTRYVAETNVAGFNLYSIVVPGSIEEFAELVVPVLQRRGLYRDKAPRATLRAGLRGTDLLPETHPAAGYRTGAAARDRKEPESHGR